MTPIIQMDTHSAILYSAVIGICITLVGFTIEKFACKFLGMCLWSRKV